MIIEAATARKPAALHYTGYCEGRSNLLVVSRIILYGDFLRILKNSE